MSGLSRNAALCDGPGCDTISREPENHGFVELIWLPDHFLFCSGDCALKFLATHSTPVETI